MTNSFRALAHHRDFTALWVGSCVSELGSRVTTFAMPLVAYALTGSAGWAAAAEALFLLGMVGALLPAGVIADRTHRLRVMRGSLATGVVLYGSLVVTGATGTLTLPHLLAVAVVTGVATGLFGPAEHSAIRSIVSTEEMPTALSQQQARQHVAGLLGGPLGGALFGLARWAPFAADALSYAVGWLLLGRVRTDLSPVPGAAPDRHGPVGELASGLRFVWQHRFLRVLLFWSPLINLAINALVFAALLRLIDAGFPAWQIGLVEAVVGGVGIVGAILAPRIIERTRTGALTVATAWSWVPIAVPIALWSHPWSMALAASIGMLLLPAGNAGVGSYRMVITPPDLIGRVQSAMQFTSMLSMPLAPALAGILLTVADGHTAILALGVVTALTALIPTLSSSVRAVPRPADWPRPPLPDASTGDDTGAVAVPATHR